MMTAPLHPSLQCLITAEEDRIADCKRKVVLLGSGDSEVIKAEERLKKVSEFVKRVDNLVNEDPRFRIVSAVSGNTFLKEIEAKTGHEYRKLANLLDLMSHPRRYREGINVPLTREFWRVLIFPGLLFIALSISVFVLTPNFLTFMVAMFFVGVISFMCLLPLLFDPPRAVLDSIDLARINVLKHRYHEQAVSYYNVAKVTFNRLWYIENIPSDLFSTNYPSAKIRFYKGEIEAITSNLSNNSEAKADPLVARLVAQLASNELPFSEWEISVNSRLMELKRLLLDDLPDLNLTISNLVNEYAYVKLSLDSYFTVLFCASNKPIEFSKDAEIKEIKPIAGYSIEEIIEYLNYAENAESETRS